MTSFIGPTSALSRVALSILEVQSQLASKVTYLNRLTVPLVKLGTLQEFLHSAQLLRHGRDFANDGDRHRWAVQGRMIVGGRTWFV